ncbi:MAG: PilZ domain-containing protein [Novosphingobium sp.]
MASIPPTDQVVREVRQPRILRARLIHRDGEVQDIVVRNVSDSGLGASARGPAPVRGERIVVVLPGEQEVTGIVRWFGGHTFGMQLDSPLDLDALALALQRQAHVAQVSGEWRVENRHRVTTPYTDPSRIRRV